MKRKPDTPLRAQERCGERDASAKASATAIVHRSRAPAIRCHAYPILSTFHRVRERSPPIASACECRKLGSAGRGAVLAGSSGGRLMLLLAVWASAWADRVVLPIGVGERGRDPGLAPRTGSAMAAGRSSGLPGG